MVLTIERHAAGTVLGEATLQDFEDSLHGTLITPADLAYDQARKLHNGMIDKRPALIAQVADTHDVVQCVNFARSHGIDIAVRGGGHSVAGHSMSQGGLTIDFSRMTKVDVDPVARVAKAQPGVKLGDYITATEVYGLVSPVGTASDTGLAGLTLGGGYGWLSGKYGMAVDNLLAAEVVTADGRVLRASDEENQDLYWALRGGSGNFGVVTSFEMKLHLLPEVLGGLLVYPFPQARAVLRFYRAVAASAPDELTVYAAMITGPDGNKAVGMALCYSGSVLKGEQVVAPIRAFGQPVLDTIARRKYSDMNSQLDDANPNGFQSYWKWNGIRELTDEAIDIIVDAFARVPSPRTAVLIDHLHGAASRVSPTATAFAHRDAPHGLVLASMWEDPADAEMNINWTRELAAATEPFSTGGVYVNGDSNGNSRTAFGVNYDRLVQIKTQYDPTNFFRNNQNIEPALSAR